MGFLQWSYCNINVAVIGLVDPLIHALMAVAVVWTFTFSVVCVFWSLDSSLLITPLLKKGSSWSVLHHSGEYGVQKQATISYVTNIILCHFHYGVTLWSQLKMMVARLLKFFFFTFAYNMHDYEFLSQFQYICTYKWCKSKLILIFIHDLDLEPHVFRYQLNMRNWVGMSHWVIWAQ